MWKIIEPIPPYIGVHRGQTAGISPDTDNHGFEPPLNTASAIIPPWFKINTDKNVEHETLFLISDNKIRTQDPAFALLSTTFHRHPLQMKFARFTWPKFELYYRSCGDNSANPIH